MKSNIKVLGKFYIKLLPNFNALGREKQELGFNMFIITLIINCIHDSIPFYLTLVHFILSYYFYFNLIHFIPFYFILSDSILNALTPFFRI